MINRRISRKAAEAKSTGNSAPFSVFQFSPSLFDSCPKTFLQQKRRKVHGASWLGWWCRRILHNSSPCKAAVQELAEHLHNAKAQTAALHMQMQPSLVTEGGRSLYDRAGAFPTRGSLPSRGAVLSSKVNMPRRMDLVFLDCPIDRTLPNLHLASFSCTKWPKEQHHRIQIPWDADRDSSSF